MLQILPRNQKPLFEDFYADNYDKVVHKVYQKISQLEDAEDLASEVFVYCYDHYDDYDPEKSSITTWLWVIVESRIKNYYRDHKIMVPIDPFIGILPEDGDDVDKAIYLEQLHKTLMKAISELPAKQRSIIRKSYFENKSGAQIAAELGISHSDVRTSLHRAIKTLGTKFESVWKEYQD